MFAEVMEWEAKGDGLRRAKRFGQALEAYRTALRHCVQWTRDARACVEIREKIWIVQIEEFEAFAAERRKLSGVDEETALLVRTDLHPDTLEWAAARLWACGALVEAEGLIRGAVRAGARGSGEFFDRLAKRQENADCAEWLRERGRQMRGEVVEKNTLSATAASNG